MQRLYRKKIIFLSFLLSFFLTAKAQVETKYLPYYDDKPTRFGFLVGSGKTHYNIRHSEDFVNNPEFLSIQSPQVNFIKIGGVINFSIYKYWDFRILPTVAIYSREFKVVKLDGTELKDLSQKDKAWFEIPFMVKFKSERRRNNRMYIQAGFKYGVQTNALGKGVSETIKIKTNDFTFDYIIGLEMFNRYFKLGPEIHFSHGLNDLVDKRGVQGNLDKTSPLSYISRLSSNTISFQLTFE